MSSARLEDSFRAAIAACGLKPPSQITIDGRLHRFSTNGRASDDSGWYVVYANGLPAGAFGDWRTGLQSTWCDKSRDLLTEAEKTALRERVRAAHLARNQAQAMSHNVAMEVAAHRWNSAGPVTAHPYLMGKGVRSHGLRQQGRFLLVPVRDVNHQLCSLQTITPDGTKRFLSGGRIRGGYHSIGKLEAPLVICEGYATGASIHEATQLPVAVAFNAGNLEQTASALRTRYPNLPLILAADDDWLTTGNPGLTAARNAALAVGGHVVKPLFPPGRAPKSTDFNDLHLASGLDVVRSFFDELRVLA